MPPTPQRRRVAITGIGIIAPNGTTVDQFWQTIREGQSAAGPLTRFDATEMPVKIACEVKNFDPCDFMDKKVARRLNLSIVYGTVAAERAVADAGLDISEMDADRIGVVEASSVSNVEATVKAEDALVSKGYKSISLFGLINGYVGSGSGEIALKLGAKGHAITLSTGSASGNDVMGYALQMIRHDEVDVMIVGGAEAPIIPPLWGTFCVGKVMSRQTGDPKKAMRPFDASRDGFVCGEGAAFLVFEELTHALARGAKIYAEVLGHGRACESYHPVAPHPEGVGILRAMDRAFKSAGIDATEIDYVNAHGTATDANDVVESLALRAFFGPAAQRLAVSSTKPVTGHLMAAAGALETVVCALAIKRQEIPMTLNHHQPAPGCDLDYVANRSRPYPIRAAMNLSSGFGGKNACLLLGKV